MRFGRLALTFLCFSLATSLAATGTVFAKTSSVGVTVSFESKDVTEAWGGAEKTKTAQRESARQLSVLLTKIFDFWDFAPGHEDRGTRLKFRVMPGLRGSVFLRVEAFLGARRVEKWDTQWLEPTAIASGDLANPETVPGDLKLAVDAEVLSRHEDAIGAWLRSSVPVATGGRWANNPASAEAILALRYDKFGLFGASEFKVVGRRQQGAPEALLVVGLSFKARYSPASGGPAFDALVVTALNREAGGRIYKIEGAGVPKARGLKLYQIYLRKSLNSLDPDVLIAPEDRG